MSNELYGRRKDDAMLPELTPEMIASLTDSQKINLRIIQNLTSLNTAINDVKHDVSIHDKLLVTGNGEPSLQERVRNLEKLAEGLKYWSRFIGGAIIIQTLAFGAATIIAIVRVLPLLEKLASQP